jgi:hypothetical protein
MIQVALMRPDFWAVEVTICGLELLQVIVSRGIGMRLILRLAGSNKASVV